MEKWCILPNNLLRKLSEDGNIVLPLLARFCKTTESELLSVLEARNNKIKNFWYLKYFKNVGSKRHYCPNKKNQ